MPSGTLTLADLKENRFQSAAAFGLDTIVEVLTRDLAAHNLIMTQLMTELCDVTGDRQRIYGTSADSDPMQEADEFDRGVASKHVGGDTVGFPLRKFTKALGWTRDYFLIHTPADIAESVLAIQKSHRRTLIRDIKRALFLPTNYTFRDRFATPMIDYPVKALVNADGARIPDGPNGEVFNGATHTHYDFLNGTAPTAAAVLALIEDVVEHGHGDEVKLYINRGAEAAVRNFTGFAAYNDPRLILGTQVNQPGERLDISRVDNRAIGIFGAAEVWVKPWMPAGYAFAFAVGDANKPLVMRQHPVGALQGLRIAAELEDYPLYAQQMESYYGVGVWTRTNGAVLYWADGASAYVAPTITG